MSRILIDGEERALKLTLGALAALEQELGGGDFEALRARLEKPSAADLLVLLHALIEGGGARLSLEALKAADIDIAAAAAAVAEAFRALDPDTEDAPPAPPGKPRAKGSPGGDGSPSRSAP